jgi:hypothetical protein
VDRSCTRLSRTLGRVPAWITQRTHLPFRRLALLSEIQIAQADEAQSERFRDKIVTSDL